MTKQVKKVAVILMVSLLVGVFTWGQVAEAKSGDVGIGFNDNPTKLPSTDLPYDNTPKADDPIVMKRPLPQTGEMLTHLGILMSGILVIILMFVMALDKQIRLSED